MRYRDYKDLKVWQKAMDLTIEVYSLVKFLPQDEKFGLSDQMRRAVVSIPSNIAEGEGRNSDKDLVKFLLIARGSLWELSTQIEICERLNFLAVSQTAPVKSLITEVSKMMNALLASLESEKQ